MVHYELQAERGSGQKHYGDIDDGNGNDDVNAHS